jgi:RNase adaptor protein for sRNA GlmZ degradation
MDIHQEMMEAAIQSIRSKLKETIKHRVEDVLSCVDQKAQGLHKELAEKIDETQVDLQAIRTSVDMRTRSLLETITDTREHLHEELQVETQIMKALTEATRCEFQTQ